MSVENVNSTCSMTAILVIGSGCALPFYLWHLYCSQTRLMVSKFLFLIIGEGSWVSSRRGFVLTGTASVHFVWQHGSGLCRCSTLSPTISASQPCFSNFSSSGRFFVSRHRSGYGKLADISIPRGSVFRKRGGSLDWLPKTFGGLVEKSPRY